MSMAAMACSGGWGDLPPDLLALIADGLPIQAYTHVRAVCTAWRAALPAASPSLLVRLDWNRHFAWFLSSRICTALHERMATLLPARSSCLGSGDGWVAVYDPIFYQLQFCLVNPLTGEEIPFHSFPHFVDQKLLVSKVVFAPNPTPSDFTAAAITGHGRVITYTAQGNSGWTDVECPRLAQGDDIADVVYHEERGGERAVYCLTRSGDVHVLRHPGPADHRGAFEPLFDKGNAVFDAAAAFAPPYDTIRECTSAKNLVVCDDGDLYQIWRNTTCTRMGQLPGGGEYRVEDKQIFVLRYYPHRRPCWVAVEDLGGHSVFVGKNNAVALRVDGGAAPELRGNCVYWIDTNLYPVQAKVFDMISGESTQCFPGVEDHSVICWYFLGEKQCSSSSSKKPNTSLSAPESD